MHRIWLTTQSPGIGSRSARGVTGNRPGALGVSDHAFSIRSLAGGSTCKCVIG